MTYDLMKYRLQVGDLVEVKNGTRYLSQHYVDGVLVGSWDYTKGDRGRVVKVWLPFPRQNEPPWVIVEPLPEFGHGKHTFAARHVHKVVDAKE